MSSEKSVNVAIAGASGAVGEALIDILQERKFPVGELALLASSRSEGKRIQFNGKSVQIQRLDAFDFSKTLHENRRSELRFDYGSDYWSAMSKIGKSAEDSIIV